jgi:hypothetical protein
MNGDAETRIIPKFKSLLRKENRKPLEGQGDLAWRVLYLLERKLTDDGAHIPEGCRLDSYFALDSGSYISNYFRIGEVTRRTHYRGFCFYVGEKDGFGMTIRMTDPPNSLGDLIRVGRENLPSLLEKAYVAQEDPSPMFLSGKILKFTETEVTLGMPLKNPKEQMRGKIADYWIPLWCGAFKPLVMTVRAYKEEEQRRSNKPT